MGLQPGMGREVWVVQVVVVVVVVVVVPVV
jgi:hypothetical protein